MRPLLLFLLLLAAPAVWGQTAALRSGTYTADNGYVVTIEATEAGLRVVEPNRTSDYARVAPGDYRFTHPSGRVYGLRVVSPTTVDAYVPGSSNPPTRLTLAEAPGVSEAAEEVNAQYLAIAERYQARMLADPNDTHLWAACAAVAMARATFDTAVYERQARALAVSLRQILTSSANPCEDAITPAVWRSAQH